MDLRHRGVFQEPAGCVAGMASLAGAGGTAGPPEGSQERRTGKTSERRGDDQMSLLRSHRVCTVFRGGGAAQLFSLRGVRGDSRSDGPPPRRREPEGSGPATSAATPCLRRREAARQSRIHPVTQRALTAAFNVLHREHLTEHLAETGDASRSNFVTGCRPSSTEPSALEARRPDRIKRPESGGGYLLPRRGVEISSPAAPLLLRDTPRGKWNAGASVGL
jgi:hypothetical protein